VADSYVLPLNKDIARNPAVKNMLINLSKKGDVERIPVDDAIVPVWKQAMAAMVERCRTWSHLETCDYVIRGEVPLASLTWKPDCVNPLCRCGAGQDIGEFQQNFGLPDACPLVTRMAISPLFAVPYGEGVGNHGISHIAEAKTQMDAGHQPAFLDHQCNSCGLPSEKSKLLLCSRCKRLYYCDKECQKRDWKKHKRVCGAP
jgi:hypothetical protein